MTSQSSAAVQASAFDPDRFTAALTDARARSIEIETNGTLPTDLVDQLIDSGIFRLWVPTHLGGSEADVATMLDAIENAAYHDGSTGWCVMIAGTTGLNAGFLPDEFAREIYGDPRAVTGGFGMPAGVATSVDGGIRVSGTWAWGSGTQHCTWIGGGVRIEDRREAPFVYFDPADVTFLDNWHVSGMKGTGSTDYSVADAFVPEGRWVSFASNPEPSTDSPLYRFSFLGALGLGVASVTVGLARRAIDELVDLGEKKPAGSSKGLAERAPVQLQLAEAEASMRAARAFMREVVADAWDTAAEAGSVTDEQKRSIRLAANHAAQSCAHAVDLCYHAAGGTAVYETSHLQRVFRDVHVATQHGMIAGRVMEPLGRMKFGLPTSTAQF